MTKGEELVQEALFNAAYQYIGNDDDKEDKTINEVIAYYLKHQSIENIIQQLAYQLFIV